jgi:tyrosine-protein kinase Etk/Wzc
LDKLQSEVKMNRDFYNAFLQQIAGAQISAAFEAAKAGGKVVILEPPAMPLKPFKPNRLGIILLSALGGVVVGLAFVILVESHDTSLNDPDEVADALGVRVVGSLPRLSLGAPNGTKNGRGWPVVDGSPQPLSWVLSAYSPESPGSYEFRRLRLLLSSLDREGRAKSYLVTSAARGEGKSTVAALLAVSLAHAKNSRVLLVDYDIRRPTLHRVFGVDANRPGLSDAIDAQSVGPEYVVELLPGRLDLLTAGTM